jgi:hypothetical protein
MGTHSKGSDAARLFDLGLIPALQQRLRVFGRAKSPGLMEPSAGTVPVSVDAFCAAMGVTISSISCMLYACHKSKDHASSALQAIRQLLSDRFSLVAAVDKGLAPAVVQGAAFGSFPEMVVGGIRDMFMLVSRVLFQHDRLDDGNKALVRRLQQQLTTFLNLDAIRPHLETLCLSLPGGVFPHFVLDSSFDCLPPDVH